MRILQRIFRRTRPPLWAVLLHARALFLLDSAGQQKTGGAYTWRFVAAADETAAVQRAIESLRASEVFKSQVRNDSANPPLFEAEEIRPTSMPDCRGEGTAVVFYIDSDGAEAAQG
jgi:hypothetical protein